MVRSIMGPIKGSFVHLSYYAQQCAVGGGAAWHCARDARPLKIRGAMRERQKLTVAFHFVVLAVLLFSFGQATGETSEYH